MGRAQRIEFLRIITLAYAIEGVNQQFSLWLFQVPLLCSKNGKPINPHFYILKFQAIPSKGLITNLY